MAFPFTDASGGNRRPALVLIDTGDEDVVVARITRRGPRDQFDVPIADLASAGLRHPSVVRPHKLTTSIKALIHQRLGELSEADWVRVRESVNCLAA